MLGANDRINIACIGVGGKGDSDSNDAGRLGGNIVAICDVDTNTLDKKQQQVILDAGRKATPEMREVRFPFRSKKRTDLNEAGGRGLYRQPVSFESQRGSDQRVISARANQGVTESQVPRQHEHAGDHQSRGRP